MEPVVLSTFLKATVEIAKSRIESALAKDGLETPAIDESALGYHLREVAFWSNQVQFFGMTSAEETNVATVPLSVDIPRRLRNLDRSSLMSESDLLNDATHCLLLGDPGAGKTTTLKRIASRLLNQPPESDADVYQYPILIRVRDLQASDNVWELLAKIVGLNYEQRTVAGKSPEMSVGKIPLDRAISNVIEESRALVLIDGLDEAPNDLRIQFETSLLKLAASLSQSRIIVTSRSGGYQRNYEGFRILELCPLEPDQVAVVALAWLGTESNSFLQALRAVPYSDLADRPLLLTQLIVLFRRTGHLPQQPTSVYRRIIQLFLEEWDNERRISRRSQYAGFTPDRKHDFLSAISYQLTYKIKRKTFSTEDLISAYNAICKTFGLAAAEAFTAAEEIEAHTGLVVKTSAGYEFSHLSLQEYLCAEYLVKAPLPESLTSYLKEYAAPIAIAVTLSSNPGAWLAALVLRPSNWEAFSEVSIDSFLRRILLEQPLFEAADSLGLAILRISTRGWSQELRLLVVNESVQESIKRALEYYAVQAFDQNTFRCSRTKRFPNSHGFEAPSLINVPRQVISLMLERGTKIMYQTVDSTLIPTNSINDLEHLLRKR